MKRISKKLATILIIVVCVGVVTTTKFLIKHFRGEGPTVPHTKIKGDDGAPIKITEFIDFQCPACAYGASVLKETMEKHPDAIRLEVKHYPLSMHRHGYSSSRYVECATKQGKFWPFQDLLLARQNNWHRLVDADPAFEKIAEDSGLDLKKLKVCLKADDVDEIIKKNKEEGRFLGIKSTPTYFINGKMVVGGRTLKEEIKKLLEAHGY